MWEQWLIFYNKTTGEEYARYTFFDSFPWEKEATIKLIAAEKGIEPADIATRVKTERKAN